ncbi:hypothetical protein KIL84_008516 [Mauremys mutica]|uniref:Uncharacterized protein n=1 Tax=Mauremys mutica TaxID=74926 RepID=A0A9D4AZI0_9SAUR|nr:hypothetical protein KIL84_008516 [Mauremys mutica]
MGCVRSGGFGRASLHPLLPQQLLNTACSGKFPPFSGHFEAVQKAEAWPVYEAWCCARHVVCSQCASRGSVGIEGPGSPLATSPARVLPASLVSQALLCKATQR